MILAAVAIISVSAVIGFLLGTHLLGQRRRRVPLNDSGYGRPCPVCGAGPTTLCREDGATLLWEMHERRAG